PVGLARLDPPYILSRKGRGGEWDVPCLRCAAGATLHSPLRCIAIRAVASGEWWAVAGSRLPFLLDQNQHGRLADPSVDFGPFERFFFAGRGGKAGNRLPDKRQRIVHGNSQTIALDEALGERLGGDDSDYAPGTIAEGAAAVSGVGLHVED